MGRFLSSADSMRITVYGRGSHGSMPHLSVDPVVLASMIVIRLQQIVSREVPPGEFAVLTVGRISAGSKSNIISDHAVLELNIRTFNTGTRDLVLNAIKRTVTGECLAAGSPKDPEFELYDHYPLTENDPAATERVSSAFREYFGDQAFTIDRQSASEDFSEIPDALGVPYTYWGIGGTDPQLYAKAQAAGTVLTDIPGNHSPKFAPVITPTLQTGTAAIVVAACAWLGNALAPSIDGCKYLRVSMNLELTPAQVVACCSTHSREPMSEAAAAGLVPRLKALADPVRLRLMTLVASREGGEACVCDLNDAFQLSDRKVLS